MQDHIVVFKMYRELGNVLLHELLRWMRTVRVQGSTRANWLRPGTLGILPSVSFKVSNRWNLQV